VRHILLWHKALMHDWPRFYFNDSEIKLI